MPSTVKTVEKPRKVQHYSDNRYLSVTLLADRLSLALECFMQDRTNCELPKSAIKEALDFLKMANKNSTALPNVLPEVYNLMKAEGHASLGKGFSGFQHFLLSSLNGLASKPETVEDKKIRELKIFFEFLGRFTSQRVPSRIDMGGYSIVVSRTK